MLLEFFRVSFILFFRLSICNLSYFIGFVLGFRDGFAKYLVGGDPHAVDCFREMDDCFVVVCVVY